MVCVEVILQTGADQGSSKIGYSISQLLPDEGLA